MWWKPLTGRQHDQDIDEELEAHLNLATQERIDGGESPDQARRAARRELGNVALAKEDTRAVWHRALIDQTLQDFQIAFRRMRTKPWSNGLAILLLSVGVGASAVAFTTVRAVLFPPLPFDDADQVVVLHHRGEAGGQEMNFPGAFGPVDFFQLRELRQVFRQVDGWTRTQAIITGPSQAEATLVEYVTSGLFEFIDADAELGRVFAEEEFEVGARDVVVISNELSQRHFGSAMPVGESLQVDGKPHDVIGVMPQGFQIPHPLRADVWLPLRFTEDQKAGRRGLPVTTLAEFRPGSSPSQSEPVLLEFNDRMNEEFGMGTFRELRLIATPLRNVFAGDIAPTLWTLSAAVGLVLLISCANAASILVAQLLVRRREIAMRSALGAARGRLQRQFFVEALTLCGPATVGAALFAWGSFYVLQASVPALLPGSPLPTAAVPGFEDAVLNETTLAFIATAGFCIAALVCIPQLVVAAATRSEEMMRSVRAAPRIEGGGSLRFLSLGQIAVTTTLLIGAGLLVRGFSELASTEPGYEREGIVAVRVPLGRHRFGPGEAQAHFMRLIARIENLPGVASVGFSLGLPTGGPAKGFHPIEYGQEPVYGEVQPVGFEVVSDNYFGTLGIPLVAGRMLDDQDSGNGPLTLIVNQALADRFWPGENVVGKRLRFRQGAEIVGVVGNVKVFDAELGDRSRIDPALLESTPIAYQSIRQANGTPFGSIFVRTNVRPESLSPLLIEVVLAAAPEQPMPTVRTLESLYSAGVWRPRLATRLMGGFALIAFLLTAGGIYGGVSFDVGRRTSEIGLRMALGATADQLVASFVKGVVALAVAGTTIGLVAAIVGSRVLESQLYGFSATDPGTYLVAVTVVLLFSATAGGVAAIRAARVDPLVALRQE